MPSMGIHSVRARKGKKVEWSLAKKLSDQAIPHQISHQKEKEYLKCVSWSN